MPSTVEHFKITWPVGTTGTQVAYTGWYLKPGHCPAAATTALKVRSPVNTGLTYVSNVIVHTLHPDGSAAYVTADVSCDTSTGLSFPCNIYTASGAALTNGVVGVGADNAFRIGLRDTGTPSKYSELHDMIADGYSKPFHVTATAQVYEVHNRGPLNTLYSGGLYDKLRPEWSVMTLQHSTGAQSMVRGGFVNSTLQRWSDAAGLGFRMRYNPSGLEITSLFPKVSAGSGHSIVMTTTGHVSDSPSSYPSDDTVQKCTFDYNVNYLGQTGLELNIEEIAGYSGSAMSSQLALLNNDFTYADSANVGNTAYMPGPGGRDEIGPFTGATRNWLFNCTPQMTKFLRRENVWLSNYQMAFINESTGQYASKLTWPAIFLFDGNSYLIDNSAVGNRPIPADGSAQSAWAWNNTNGRFEAGGSSWAKPNDPAGTGLVPDMSHQPHYGLFAAISGDPWAIDLVKRQVSYSQYYIPLSNGSTNANDGSPSYPITSNYAYDWQLANVPSATNASAGLNDQVRGNSWALFKRAFLMNILRTTDPFYPTADKAWKDGMSWIAGRAGVDCSANAPLNADIKSKLGLHVKGSHKYGTIDVASSWGPIPLGVANTNGRQVAPWQHYFMDTAFGYLYQQGKTAEALPYLNMRWAGIKNQLADFGADAKRILLGYNPVFYSRVALPNGTAAERFIENAADMIYANPVAQLPGDDMAATDNVHGYALSWLRNAIAAQSFQPDFVTVVNQIEALGGWAGAGWIDANHTKFTANAHTMVSLDPTPLGALLNFTVTSNNAASPVVSGTGAEQNSTVQILNAAGNAVVATGQANNNGDFNIPVSGLGAGTYSVYARQMGNADQTPEVGPNTANVSITVAGSAPAAPAVSAATSSAVTGTGTPGATITVTVTGPGGPYTATGTVDGSGNFSVPVPGSLPPGSFSATATQTVGGNTGPASSPAATFTKQPVAPAVTAGSATTVSGTATPGATVTYTLSTAATGTATANASGVWSATLSPTLTAGSYNATATQTVNGQTGPASSAHAWTIAAPVSVAPAITAASATSISGTGVAGSTIAITVNPGGAVYSATVTGGGTWSVSGPALSPGNYTATATQTEPGKTVSPATSPFAFTVAVPVPSAPTVGSSNSTGANGTAQPGAAITVTIGGPGGPYTVTTTANGSGAWSVGYPPPALNPGTYTVGVTQTVAGQTSASASAPGFSIAAPPSGNTVLVRIQGKLVRFMGKLFRWRL